MTTDPAPTTVFSPIVTPGQTITPAAQPDVVADGHGRRPLPARPAALGVEFMGGREELDVRADLDVGADGDRRAVEEDRAEVDERTGADADVRPEVAVERGPDPYVLGHRPQQLAQDPLAPVGIGQALAAGAVVRGAEVGPPSRLGLQLLVVRQIPLAGLHQLLVLAHLRACPFVGSSTTVGRGAGSRDGTPHPVDRRAPAQVVQ